MRAEVVDRIFVILAVLIAAAAAVTGDLFVVGAMAVVAMGAQARSWVRRRHPEKYDARGWPISRARR